MKAINKAKLIYLGRFNETDLKQKRDREAIAAGKQEHPTHKYIYAEDVKRRGVVVALDVYLSPEYV